MNQELQSLKSHKFLESRKILGYTPLEVKEFFLKQESYCNFDLPNYFSFTDLLNDVSRLLNNKLLNSFKKEWPSKYEKVNHTILNNKDGKYAWRPLQLIHPVIYVSLVNAISQENNWKIITKRFEEFAQDPKIKCLSLPLESKTLWTDKACSVDKWISEIEQKSIELSLQYEYILHTDISDCYGTIYTHSLPWALHGKSVAKETRSDDLLGNIIDRHIQNMSHGQTNGIPQGSALSDFLAEIILGYVDLQLSKKTRNIEDFQVLRYRDDYRIFTNNPKDAEEITKYLTEILIGLGSMRLNNHKTLSSCDVVKNSIKPDKFYYITKKMNSNNLQRNLLIIYDLSLKFPNSGSIKKALNKFYRHIDSYETLPSDYLALISILVNIAYNNPNSYSYSSAILSKFINLIPSKEEKENIIELIHKKFNKLPNIGYLHIWLQRMTYGINKDKNYEEILCKKIINPDTKVWESSWIKNGELRNLMEKEDIILGNFLESMDAFISLVEVELFDSSYE